MDSRYRQYATACFQSAFPGSLAQYRGARRKLRSIEDRVLALPRGERRKLEDTGIGATAVRYAFSFEVARWLARKCPGAVSIDWEETGDTLRLDELLRHIIEPGEDEYFDSGYVETREWIDQARSGTRGTDFDWLLAQLGGKRLRGIWAHLYDAAEIPLIWQLGSSRFSKSRNVLPVNCLRTRQHMRKRPRHPKRAILEPVTLRLLPERDGARLIDIAIASLAVRHRETTHFNHANAKEVYLADAGEGVAVAVFGLLPEHRYPLECTMGFLLLSNGVPIGYGGSSSVFRQVNTGINVFDEYRGSEAAFLWTQVMRVYHALTGCTRFIANAYQFGGDNDEAVESGAFWFYYRIGYRPVDAAVRKLARDQAKLIRQDRSYRTSRATLRQLASCDMHLVLPGARASELFDEEWLVTSSMLASAMIGAAPAARHDAAAAAVAAAVARDLGIRGLDRWSAPERRGLRAIAPFVAAIDTASWTREDKAAMRALLRAKGGHKEARYARLLCKHDKFLISLKKACKRPSSK